MRLLDILLGFAGSLTTIRQWPSYIAWPRYFRTRATHGAPPTDYEILNQQELLAQFSDAQGRSAITPRALRNFVGSTVTTLAAPIGADVFSAPVPLPLPGWTIATRPTELAGPCIGYNYDLQTLDLWDERAGIWVNPAFNGGVVTGDVTFTGNVALPELQTAPGETNTLWNNGRVVGIS